MRFLEDYETKKEISFIEHNGKIIHGTSKAFSMLSSLGSHIIKPHDIHHSQLLSDYADNELINDWEAFDYLNELHHATHRETGEHVAPFTPIEELSEQGIKGDIRELCKMLLISEVIAINLTLCNSGYLTN